MNIGRNMAIMMYDKKITVKNLAKEVGVSEGMISYVKSGEKIPSVAVLKRIADALGCSIDELVKTV